MAIWDRWNRDAEGNRSIWSHAQNLNERRHGPDGPMWRHGRAWLHFPGVEGRDGYFGVEWAVFGRDRWPKVGVEINQTFGEDYDLSTTLCLPFLGALYLHLSGIFPRRWKGDAKNFSVALYQEYLWIEFFWTDPAKTWGKDRNRFPAFRISWNWQRTLMGRMDYKREPVGSPKEILIPMPEGSYPAMMQIERQVWWRTRWPWRKERVSADIDLGRGIPIPGKGENSWDCGEDAICGMGSGPSVAEAVSAVTKSVLEARERYGGSANWRPRERV